MNLNPIDRPRVANPYDFLPATPTFDLSSNTPGVTDGADLPFSITAAGGSVSPQLSWCNFPAETKSFAVTCFDPDAPTPSGFWHWLRVNIPAAVTDLPADINASDFSLGLTTRNDTGQSNFFGAAPPLGDHYHRYIFAVHALDCEKLDVTADTSPAAVSFNLVFHTLARAYLTLNYAR